MSICALLEPDTSGMNTGTGTQANLSPEQLEWAKQLYAEIAPQHAAATVPADEVIKELDKPVADPESSQVKKGARHGK